ncbi:cation diffusion facilitator family transporter [Blastococcus mobilis]|uniref:Cation efflux family protein n=1 Tax=Blastococcus mobilis TaxID=1938746 RepID=A0A238W2D3_9ACTN|nr:cation transporter [Blastococcus mobilis]SNR40720.1 Cation efflux family protein [Blastococcus mobilis]
MSATHAHIHADLTAAERARLGRRARLLAGGSAAYNVLEAVVAITAGLVAGSVALVGFGLDSVVEVSSAVIILWQFSHRLPETRERRAQRAMAIAFGALSLFVLVESVRALVTGAEPEASPVGIGLTLASLLVMPFLSRAQRRTGRALGSAAVTADGTQTGLCAALSATTAVGLILNAAFGWSFADPVAALVISVVAAREAVLAWRGEGCCAPVGAGGHAPEDAAGGCGDGCTDGCCGHAPAAMKILTIAPREQPR